jgi:hypothetical protein
MGNGEWGMGNREWAKGKRQKAILPISPSPPLVQLQGTSGDFFPGRNGTHPSYPSGLFLVFGEVVVKRVMAILSLLVIGTGNASVDHARGIDLFIHPNSHRVYTPKVRNI